MLQCNVLEHTYSIEQFLRRMARERVGGWIIQLFNEGYYGQTGVKKVEVSSIISEISKLLCASLDRGMIIKYLQKDMEALSNKSPEDLKKVIQTYVEKVLT